MGKCLLTFGLLVICSMCVLCGCSGPFLTPAPVINHTILSTITPTGSYATVTISGNDITIEGDGPVTSEPFPLVRGAYEVKWSGSAAGDENVLMYLIDSTGHNALTINGGHSQDFIMPVDDKFKKSGMARLRVAAGKQWRVNLTLPDPSTFYATTNTFVGGNNSLFLGRLRVKGWHVTVKVNLTDMPTEPRISEMFDTRIGILGIIDVRTGKPVVDQTFRPEKNGQFDVRLPGPGAYLTAVTFPRGTEGTITLVAS